MAKAHNTGLHLFVRKLREKRDVHRWGPFCFVKLSVKDAGWVVEPCHVRPIVNIYVQVLWAAKQKPLSLFPIMSNLSSEYLFSYRGSYFDESETHASQSSPLKQKFVVYTEFLSSPLRESFAVCHTFLLTLIHMLMRILRVDFSFHIGTEQRSLGVTSHVNTCIPLRHTGNTAWHFLPNMLARNPNSLLRWSSFCTSPFSWLEIKKRGHSVTKKSIDVL